MKPGEHATHVKLPEDEATRTDPEPFMGGWGMTGSCFMFLADLTQERRFVLPYTEYFLANRKITGAHFAELQQMGGVVDMLIPDLPWNTILYTKGDKRPFIAAMKKDIEELQRFGHMYTTLEPFTDRVFLYPIINPTIAYTGGYTTRNKLNLNYAITYDGLGTDYAALVTKATSETLRVSLCNLSDKPITGRARLWRLKPGVYHSFLGPDANGNDEIDDLRTRRTTHVLRRGDEIELTLPPKQVHVLQLMWAAPLPEIFERADLALSPLELKVGDGTISGVAHNIGTVAVEKTLVSLIDNKGRVVETQPMGKLDAPLDLRPRTAPFQFDNLPANTSGWSIMLDLQDTVPEINEGNNRLPVGK
jgi:hypothetical protein